MGSITKFFYQLLKGIFTVPLILLLMAYPIAAATDQEPAKTESTENIKDVKSAAGGQENAGSQEDTVINENNPAKQEIGEEELSPIPDANVAKAEVAPDTEKSSPEQTVYPGVKNASIIRKNVDGPSVEIYYPVFGNQPVDLAIKLFAEKQAAEYEKDVAESAASDEERPDGYERWEMSGYFNIERPNPKIVSVIFNIFSYSGGAHGNLLINCLNYNLATGKPVDFADLFKDPEKALEMMSVFSAKKLNTELGDYADEDMILSGTSPDLTNFSNLSLVPDGLYIEFQPYQVGPWAAGPQRVEMTLQDLAAAGPEPDIWPAALNLPITSTENKTEDGVAADPAVANQQD